ncbi:hypothetical protein B0H14DRAFT_3488615 [Mycena olivaceomarginata]|nr:hypothetical protein B0H14DRAFT_3488615 [Mycena olivaceomarginata]
MSMQQLFGAYNKARLESNPRRNALTQLRGAQRWPSALILSAVVLLIACIVAGLVAVIAYPTQTLSAKTRTTPSIVDESDGGDGEKDDDPQDVVQGELKEACGVLPDAYRGRNQRKKQWVIYEFNFGFNHQRWNTTNRVRHSMDTIAVGIVYGPTKAEHVATANDTGLIANAAIYALWTLSADVLMAEKGTQTGINWNPPRRILVYLLTGLAERRRGIVELFRAWDDVLFPDAEERAWELLGGRSLQQEEPEADVEQSGRGEEESQVVQPGG